jgi:hypothetical protein
VCSEISRASCKREERRLELGVLAGELWARRRSARRRGYGMRRFYQRFRTLRRVWWRGRLARGALESAEFLAKVPACGSEIQSRMGAGLWRKRRGETLSGDAPEHGEEYRVGEISRGPCLTVKWWCSLLTAAARRLLV